MAGFANLKEADGDDQYRLFQSRLDRVTIQLPVPRGSYYDCLACS